MIYKACMFNIFVASYELIYYLLLFWLAGTNMDEIHAIPIALLLFGSSFILCRHSQVT